MKALKEIIVILSVHNTETHNKKKTMWQKIHL